MSEYHEYLFGIKLSVCFLFMHKSKNPFVTKCLFFIYAQKKLIMSEYHEYLFEIRLSVCFLFMHKSKNPFVTKCLGVMCVFT